MGSGVGVGLGGFEPPGTAVDAVDGVGVVGAEGSQMRLPTDKRMLSRQLTSMIRSTVVPVLRAMVERLSPDDIVYLIHLPGF